MFDILSIFTLENIINYCIFTYLVSFVIGLGLVYNIIFGKLELNKKLLIGYVVLTAISPIFITILLANKFAIWILSIK